MATFCLFNPANKAINNFKIEGSRTMFAHEKPILQSIMEIHQYSYYRALRTYDGPTSWAQQIPLSSFVQSERFIARYDANVTTNIMHAKNLWTVTDFGEFFHREQLNQDSAPLNLRFPPQNLPALVSGSMLQPRGHSGDNLAQRHRCRAGHLRCLRIPTRAHPRGVLDMYDVFHIILYGTHGRVMM